MGNKITFNERVIGNVNLQENNSSNLGGPPLKSYSKAEPRVKFIRGQLVDGGELPAGGVRCGEGTDYPLEVTVEQLEAIMYRVKDSKFTAGAFSVIDLSDNVYTTTFEFEEPSASFVVADAYYYSLRSYCTFLDAATAPPEGPMADYGSDFFGATYTVEIPYGEGDIVVRDATSELALWTVYDNSAYPFYYTLEPDQSPIGHFDVSQATLAPFGDYFAYPLPYSELSFFSQFEHIGANSFKTGFSFVSETDFGSTTGYRPILRIESVTEPVGTFIESGSAQVAFSGRVAFIDNAGNGNPYDSANRLFIAMEFSIIGFDGTASFFASTFYSFLFGSEVYSTFELNFGASGIPPASCPIRVEAPAELTASTPFVLTATEWWPYADEDGNPIWDSSTGSKL